MSQKFNILSYLFVLLASFIGLTLSGVFSDSPSAGVIAAAIIGTVVIATITWKAAQFFIAAYMRQPNKRTK